MNLTKRVLVCASVIFLAAAAFAEDAFAGRYYRENQADYDAEKSYYEITRNRYQEMVVNTATLSGCVAFYDAENHELFFVIERPAAFGTLVKFRIEGDRLTVYRLEGNRWVLQPGRYVKTKR